MTALHKTAAITVLFLILLGIFARSVAMADNPPTTQPTTQPAGPKMEFEQHVIILLVLGDNPPKLSDEESQALQAKHIQHIVSMWEAGKLVVAGPFGNQDDPKIRGILIFNCPIDEAKALAGEDPAVKAGRLKPVAQVWYHEKDAVEFPKAKSPATTPSGKPQT